MENKHIHKEYNIDATIQLVIQSFDVMRAEQSPVSCLQLQSGAVAGTEGLNGAAAEAGCHFEGVPVAHGY